MLEKAAAVSNHFQNNMLIQDGNEQYRYQEKQPVFDP